MFAIILDRNFHSEGITNNPWPRTQVATGVEDKLIPPKAANQSS